MTRLLITSLFVLLSAAALADAYSNARAELIAAYQAKDFIAMQDAAQDALRARPGYPGAQFNLALAKSLGGDNQGALNILHALVRSGMDYGVVDVDEFAALQNLPDWQAYAADVALLQEPVGAATVAFSYDDSDFVPEGIALIDGDIVLGSIRKGDIVRIGERTEMLSDAEAAGHWSVFGMRIGPDGALWFASAAISEYANVSDDQLGSTGLYRLDLETKQVTAEAVLADRDQAMVLGDFLFTDQDTIYATESLLGALYRFKVSTGDLSQVIAPGTFHSLQGLVLDSSGEYLYVADYVGGLFRIRLSDHRIARVTADASVNLFGIDGLYRFGNELIAIQNGIRPNRVVAFTLADDGRSVIASRVLARNLPAFDEPTLGTIVGDDLLFVANSHWNRFDRDGNLAAELSGPIVLRLNLMISGK